MTLLTLRAVEKSVTLYWTVRHWYQAKGAEDVKGIIEVRQCLGQGGLAFGLGVEVIVFGMWDFVGAKWLCLP